MGQMHGSSVSGGTQGTKGTTTQGRQQAAFHYFETRTPQQVFTMTLESLWTQATALFGEDAEQLICDAIKTDDPTGYIQQYLPSFTPPDMAA